MSLIEVLISVLVLGLLITTMTALFPMSTQLRQRSQERSIAATLVQRKLAQVRQFRYDQVNYQVLTENGIVDGRVGGNDFVLAFTQTDNVDGRLPNGTGIVELTFPEAGLVRVDVEVTWEGRIVRGNLAHAVTYVSNRDVIVLNP